MKGIVLKSTGSRYIVLDENKDTRECKLKGKFRLSGIKSTNPIAVGDNIEFDEENDDKGIIHTIHERKNYIVRKSINLSKQLHIIAANIDQALLIVTLANPRTSQGFIDRFLITAEAYHIQTKIIFNKLDLFEDDEIKMQELDEFIAIYENIGYKCYKVSSTTHKGINNIIELTKDKTTMVSGHSGVGKSTLLNALDEDLDITEGELSEAHSKGKHTTTFAEMHLLSYGGAIIDTPGIKELGLVNMTKEEISGYFKEMAAIKNECKFNNCLHIKEPKCAVIEAVKNGRIDPSRYASYFGIIHSEEVNP